ncbi:hypothetical protein [Candidatus Accumulibacter cognatus]|uniref:Uncharacterized protein n=1 Tax=Candidatus Accumulibacter cognatus TaxID=2954383 RepID=A0A080MAC3_9PROT|nr:hypothetical protein [Candidatus Accumulibacter cognatus]KFB78188.1 MAG: hypothetical protein AW06_000411 [Candidatus Accumulibacter cognatus]QLH50172.1 MAG: hypothetical protein HWD57_10570 [Candidatus Accumulibacter cognatus]
MGLIYAALRLTNHFTNQQVQAKALVNTGATFRVEGWRTTSSPYSCSGMAGRQSVIHTITLINIGLSGNGTKPKRW